MIEEIWFEIFVFYVFFWLLITPFYNFKIFKNFRFSKFLNFSKLSKENVTNVVTFSVSQWQLVPMSCETVSVLARPHEWTVLWLVSILHRDWPQKLIKLKQSPKVQQSAYQFCPNNEEKYLFLLINQFGKIMSKMLKNERVPIKIQPKGLFFAWVLGD